MKKILFVFIILFCFVFAQSIDVKDSAGQTLMQVNDEGDLNSSITIPNSSLPPEEYENKLYNHNGVLTWNGTVIGTGSSGDGYSLDASDGTPIDALYTNTSGDIGVGTTTPEGVLDLQSTTGALIVPRMTNIQRNNLPIINGSIIYNSDTDEFNFYENGSWVGL